MLTGTLREVRLDSPATVLHRGAHAPDRARGTIRIQPHSCAGRRGGAAGESADHRRSGSWVSQFGKILADFSGGDARAGLRGGTDRTLRVPVGPRTGWPPSRIGSGAGST